MAKVIVLDLNNKIERDAAATLAIAPYVNEPCRVCGVNFTWETIKEALWAGHGQRGRCAHKECFSKPKDQWFDPVDG